MVVSRWWFDGGSRTKYKTKNNNKKQNKMIIVIRDGRFGRLKWFRKEGAAAANKKTSLHPFDECGNNCFVNRAVQQNK